MEYTVAEFSAVASPTVKAMITKFKVKPAQALEAYGFACRFNAADKPAPSIEDIEVYVKWLMGSKVETLSDDEKSFCIALGMLKMIPPPFKAVASKIGRNDPCPCKSGKKFKQCCYDKIQELDNRRRRGGM